MEEKNNVFDLIIVGSGAAGLAAALYASRYLLKTLVIGEKFGGETATAGAIENYPGFQSIDGFDLMIKMKEQVEAVGAQVLTGRVNAIKNNHGCYSVRAGETMYQCTSLIISVGAERRRLGLPLEREFSGKGVHYCVTCDGPLYRNKVTAMVGGGDAAIKGVNFLAQYAQKVYVLVRGKALRAEPINAEHLKKLGDKVEILYGTEVKEIVGEKKLEKIILTRPYQDSLELALHGMFVEIGAQPNLDFAKSLNLEMDERGYLKTDTMMRTNAPGVFGAGDIVNLFGGFKQDITAAAMGAVAATSAFEYKKVHGDLCVFHAKPISA